MKRTIKWGATLLILGYGVMLYASDIIQPINITQTSDCNGLVVQPACVPGGAITLSTFTATGGFCFADGTCQTTAAGGVFGAGSASAPSVAIGETNTGFYLSASHQVSFTSNGTRRLDFAANGIGNASDSDTSGMFFSGADTNILAGNTGIVRFQNGSSGATAMTIDLTNSLITISASSTTWTGSNAPPDSKALCLLSGQLGHCTTVVGATGGCTCVAP